MSVVLSILIMAGTVLFGLLAGSAVDRGIMSFPARRRVGTIAWARYSRATDLGNGVPFAMTLWALVVGSRPGA